MPDLTATVYPDEAYVLLQADWSGALLRDQFQRNVNPGWGNSDTEQPWTPDGGSATDYFVNGSQGVMSHGTINVFRREFSSATGQNFDYSGIFYNTATPSGDLFVVGMRGRFVDNNNFLGARLFLDSALVVGVNINQFLGGVETFSGFPVAAGVLANIPIAWRFYANGADVRFKVWQFGSPEPAAWTVTFTATLLVSGQFELNTFLAPGVLNALPVVFMWDSILAIDLDATTADCAIVTRRNTITGEIVNLRPYIFYNSDGALFLECGLGLWWDTEPPLNVELEYCTTACDTPVVVSQNPDFESSVAGWTAGGGATLAQDCTVAKVGTCSGRITPGGTLTNPFISQSGITLVASREVTFSGWAMSPQGWNSVLLRLVVTYSDLTSATFETPLVTLDDNEWRFLAFSFSPSLAVTDATFSFVAAGLPPNTTLFHVDDLKVTQLADSLATDCESVTVENDSVWLKSPLHPCDDVEIGLCSPMLADCEETDRVSYVGTTDDNYAANTVLLSPVNRQHPIPINRIRRAPTATLRLLAHDCDAKDAVLAINEPGDPLLFQAPATYCIPDRYISVGALDETRISVDQREDFRLMTLPYATVARPEGPMDGPCGARIQDLCDIYSSWAALEMAGLTWTDLMLGEASPNGPGQDPPPAAARDWDEVETEFTDWDDVEDGGTRDWDELRDGL